LRGLLEPKGQSRGLARAAFHWALLSLFSATALKGALAPLSGPNELPALPALAELFQGALACGLAGFAAFAFAGGRRAAISGAVCGLVWGALGYWARYWLVLCAALRLAGHFFAGPFLGAAMPWLLSASAAAAAWALINPEARPFRLNAVAALLIASSVPAYAVSYRLRAAWGFGPRSLSEAAGLPKAPEASDFLIAWLRPSADRPYVLEDFKALPAGAAELSYENLNRLYNFLERSRGRDLFAKQALGLLRSGWLIWWDSDRALEADLLSYPGRSSPDYLKGLALLRSGPLTPERYAKLLAFDDEAGNSRAGFEDVNRSQLIFEAFSAAYARFGDERKSKQWIYRVDNLWPIYDKKIEVSPVENFRGGTLEGSVFIDKEPASGVRVGLFFIAPSSSSASAPGILSGSLLPEASGRFRFANLGAGHYYLALLARGEKLRGRIMGAPGIVELTADIPEIALEPIDIEPEAQPAPEVKAGVGNRLSLPAQALQKEFIDRP
jgi:hypothetical protein